LNPRGFQQALHDHSLCLLLGIKDLHEFFVRIRAWRGTGVVRHASSIHKSVSRLRQSLHRCLAVTEVHHPSGVESGWKADTMGSRAAQRWGTTHHQNKRCGDVGSAIWGAAWKFRKVAQSLGHNTMRRWRKLERSEGCK